MGAQVEKYVVESELGGGGMARVYKVRHALLGSTHALKVLNPDLVRDDELRSRFLAEGQIQARLRHPNIVAVTDIVAVPGIAGLVMDYVEGPTLEHLIESSKTPPSAELVRDVFRQVLAGVGHAHRHGVIHRDIKPSNVMLEEKGAGRYHARILDFGIAKVADEGQKRSTRAGARMGTPHYMSPEQVRGARDVSPRSDIFSLGATLFEFAVGRLAFDGDSDYDIHDKIVRGLFEKPESVYPGIDRSIAAAIVKALSPEPEKRFGSCEEFSAALEGEPVRTAPPTTPGRGLKTLVFLLLAVVLLGAAGVVGWKFLRPVEEPEPPVVVPAKPAQESKDEPLEPTPATTREEPEPPKTGEAEPKSDPAPEPPKSDPVPEPPKADPTPVPEPPKTDPTPVPEPPKADPKPVPEPPKADPTPVPEPPKGDPKPLPEPEPDPGKLTKLPRPGGKLPLRLVPAGMVAIEASEFQQGRKGAAGTATDTPEHPVKVAAFAIGKTEVSVGDFKKYVEASRRDAQVIPQALKATTRFDSLPVVNVDYAAAQRYCAWKISGGRLPTESEWELAARGSTGRSYPWGNGWKGACVNGLKGEKGALTNVGSLPCGATPEGILDLAGNAWEWTSSPPSRYPGSKASMPGSGFRVIRGGSFYNTDRNEFLSTTRRFAQSANQYLGFRCAYSLKG